MRPNTVAWMKCESKGKPKHTIVVQDSVVNLARQLALWMLNVEMGHRLVITIGRDETDVNPISATEDAIREFDSMLEDALKMDNPFSPAEIVPIAVSSDSCSHPTVTIRGAFHVCDVCHKIVEV